MNNLISYSLGFFSGFLIVWMLFRIYKKNFIDNGGDKRKT